MYILLYMEKQHPYMSPLYVFVQLYFSSLLRSLRHKLWWKYILFQFQYYFHYIVITFSFSYHYRYVHYAVIKTKRIIFLVNNKISFATTFTTPRSWKIAYFSFTTTTSFTTAWFWQKILSWLYSHHFQFSAISTFSTTFTMSWSRELFFSIFCYIHYVMIKRKKINLVTTITTPQP